MLTHTIPHDFRLNQNILKPRMTFFKIGIARDKPPHDFRSLAGDTISLDISVFLTEFLISGHIADNILCHLHNIPNLHAVKREPITPLGVGHITLCNSQGIIVKSGIISRNFLNAVSLNGIEHSLADFISGSHFTSAGPQFLNIAGNFPIIISSPHEIPLIVENVPIYKTGSFINIALGIHYRPSAIIDKNATHIHAGFAVFVSFSQCVSSFSINHQNIVSTLINHNL